MTHRVQLILLGFLGRKSAFFFKSVTFSEIRLRDFFIYVKVTRRCCLLSRILEHYLLNVRYLRKLSISIEKFAIISQKSSIFQFCRGQTPID